MRASDFFGIGLSLAREGDIEQAKAAFIEAIALDPGYAEAYCNLGYVLYLAGRVVEAEACLLKAIQLKRDFTDAYNNLSLVLMDTGRAQEAEECLRQAIELQPASPALYNNLALLLEDGERREEAEAMYRRAVELYPGYAEAYYNLGNYLKASGRLAEAEGSYLAALKSRPDYPDVKFALATLCLLQGNFADGWKDYNALRLKKAGQLMSTPVWQGESLSGRRILLFHQQGLGDSIQFVRFASQVAGLAPAVSLMVQEPLKRLAAMSFPHVKICGAEDLTEGRFDFQCPLPDLPMLFQITDGTIPFASQYLRPSAELINKWRNILRQAEGGGLARVGFVWAGNPAHHNDRNRSIPFNVFEQLLAIEKVNWVSLQVGQQTESLAKTKYIVADFSPRLSDFAETAGLIMNLDLVITVDSAVAHLAGALGREVWTMLPYAPDWRWQLNRDDSPWYSSMRLIRQNDPGNWLEVLEKVKRLLAEKYGQVNT